LSGVSVQELNALDSNGAVGVTAGLFKGQGVSLHTCQSGNNDPATFTYDENQGGVCNGGTCTAPQTAQGTFCVDKNTGRVTLSGFSGAFGGSPPVFYLSAGNQGFVVGTDANVTSGRFEPQSTTILANALYEGSTSNPVSAMVTNSVSWLYADGKGSITGQQDTSGPSGQNNNLPISYTYAVDNTGRALVCSSGTCNAQSKNIVGIAYVVSPTKFVLLPLLNPDNSPDQYPALSIIGQ
jgi:hypothetical protein